MRRELECCAIQLITADCDQRSMDECVLRIASVCTAQNGLDAESIPNILAMVRELCYVSHRPHDNLQVQSECDTTQSLDKLKHDNLPQAAVNVVQRCVSFAVCAV